MKSVAQLYRVVRHIPPSQLLERLRLTVKRVVLSSAPGRPRHRTGFQALTVSEDFPPALFAPRRAIVNHSSQQPCIEHLGHSVPLTVPFDWSLSAIPAVTHLQRLAIHYHEFLEAVDFQTGTGLILDWVEKHPPYRPGYWLDSWNAYAVSLRCVCWMHWLTIHASDLNDDSQKTILSSLSEQIHFLERNLEVDIRGNHLIKNIKCLILAGRFFAGHKAAQWMTQGRQMLFREVEMQFQNDGMHFELSPAYHCQVFADCVEAASALPATDRSEVVLRLKPAADALHQMTHPDGLVSLFSDGGLHMAYLPSECLAAYESMGGELPVQRSVFRLDEAGYFGVRTGRRFVVMDAGSPCADSLPAHGHADVFSFEMDVDDLRIVVDQGVYEYEAGDLRTASRTVVSHNTVSVGERDQCEFVGSFRVGRRARIRDRSVTATEKSIDIDAAHDGFSRTSDRVIHRRRFRADGQSVQVKDSVEGATGEEVVARILLHDQCEVFKDSTTTVRVVRGGTVVVVAADCGIEVRSTEWFPDFGHRVATNRLELTYGTAPCEGSFTISVMSENLPLSLQSRNS